MGDSLKQIGDLCESIGKGIYFITHPMEMASAAWTVIDSSSFFVLMVVCMGGVIVFILGYEKGKKIAIGSVGLYLVIRMISAGM